MIAYLEEIIYKSFNIKSIKKFAPPPTATLKNARYARKLIKGKKMVFYPKDLNKVDILPRQRTDDVDVKWR